MIQRFAEMKALSSFSDDEKSTEKVLVGKSVVSDFNTDTNDSFSGLESEDEGRTGRRDRENNIVHPYQVCA